MCSDARLSLGADGCGAGAIYPAGGVQRVKLILQVDGGARGNPGPAAIGVVVCDPHGQVLDEVAEPIGVATNNVAEYVAVLRGLERARVHGALEVEIVGDSQLVARQLSGAYKVKHPSIKPLYLEAIAALRGFERWEVRTVPRAQNARADALVNAALDGRAEPAHLRGCPPGGSARLSTMTDALIELSTRLEQTAQRLRSGELEADGALAAIEECARLASEASAHVDERARAVLEPLPDLPGQLPLPAPQ